MGPIPASFGEASVPTAASKKKKKKKEPEVVLDPQQVELMAWTKGKLKPLKKTVTFDEPMLISVLVAALSVDEVRLLVSENLGNSKEANRFANDFIARWSELQKAATPPQAAAVEPAPAAKPGGKKKPKKTTGLLGFVMTPHHGIAET
eukprot:NODE_9458_length_641_cov_24.009653_g9192_i0.p1 GENE.NODE_9458_length_641_cov_24.009653_g9192_i0~~NODE_9458_length_641_cov_24.009653_g9192_i0.p1  ORF type:complete len:148 (-),score=34.10 NODE_9458_length_641_cov_24.009653_g9192_i0:161-604(-)